MAQELEEDKTMMGKARKATMSMKSCSKLKLKNQNLKESKFPKRIVLLLQSYPEVKKKIKLFKLKPPMRCAETFESKRNRNQEVPERFHLSETSDLRLPILIP